MSKRAAKFTVMPRSPRFIRPQERARDQRLYRRVTSVPLTGYGYYGQRSVVARGV